MSNKFTRSLISVVSTVGLVASAMTGLLYSAPVSANTTTGITNPTGAGTDNAIFIAGRARSLEFTVRNVSGSSSDIEVNLASTTQTILAGLVPDSGCNVTVSGGKTITPSGTAACLAVFGYTGSVAPGNFNNQTGLLVQNVANNETITVTLSAVVNTVTPNNSNNEISGNIYSNLVALTGTNADLRTGFTFDSKYGRNLSITKLTTSTSSLLSEYGITLGANPTAAFQDKLFAIVIDNDSQVPYTNLSLRDYLDSSSQGYFNGAQADVFQVRGAGVAGVTSVATYTGGAKDFTINSLTVPASASSSSPTGRLVVVVGLDQNNNTLPTNFNGANIAEITQFANSNDSSPSYVLPLSANAPITGGGNVKVEKTVVSQSNSTIGSGTDVTYRLKTTNTSSRVADDFWLVDIIQTPTGVQATTLGSPVGNTTNPFQFDSTSTNVVSPANIAAAYPGSTTLSNGAAQTARFIQVQKLRAGDSFQIDYTIRYAGTFPTTCAIDAPAPVLRNTAVLTKVGSAPFVTPFVATVVPTTVNNLNVGGIADFVKYDVSGTATTATVLNSVLFNDSDSQDNLARVEQNNDVCEPDLQLIDVRKTGATDGLTTNNSQANIGETTEYTVRYRNYGAKVNGTNDIRSGAKGVTASLTLAEGASFVAITSPAGATASVSGRNVTITGLPDIALGDDTNKDLKITVKQTTNKSLVNTEATLIARVNANREVSGFNIDQREKTNTLLANQIDNQNSPTTYASNDSRGNNSSQFKLTLKGGPDLQVVKTVDIGEGQLKADTNMLQYTIKVKNIGTETANGIQLRDVFDSCTTFDSKVSGPDGTLNSDQRTIDYAIGNLNVDQEVTVVFKAKITQRTNPCDNKISNVATAVLTSGQTDVNKANDTSTANSTTFPINTNADLMKTVDQLVAQPGSTLTYTITFKASNADFSGKLEDQLADKLTFVSANPAVTSSANNKLVWEGVNLKRGEQLVATVKATVKGDASGSVINSATATTTDGKITLSNNAVTSIEVSGNSKINGYIYFDANRNGKEDAKERDAMYADYLGNIAVVAKYSNGKETRVTTDKTGAFMFDKLVAGRYTIAIDINTVKGSFKNVQLNVAAQGTSTDGLSKVQEVPVGGTIDLTAAFRLFTGQTSTGAVANGASSLTGLVALLSFSFLATLAYSQARKRALSL